MLRLVWEATVGCGFSSPMLATTRNQVLAFGTKTSVQPHGAWKTSRATNFPSRFHESHSSGVPFDICIENLLKDLSGEGAFITGREPWTRLLGVDGSPSEPTSPHIFKYRL